MTERAPQQLLKIDVYLTPQDTHLHADSVPMSVLPTATEHYSSQGGDDG